MRVELNGAPAGVPAMDKKKTIAVLGIGNLLMGDEGFGVHVIRYLEEHYRFPDQVLLHDVGTAGIYLGPVLEEADLVLVIDVIKSDSPPGTLEFLDQEMISGRVVQSAMSPHQLGILEIIDICRLRGREPERVEFFCVVPRRIELGLDLTPELRQQVPVVSDRIVQRIREAGYPVPHA